jgi:hypothetical protein
VDSDVNPEIKILSTGFELFARASPFAEDFSVSEPYFQS